MAGTSTDLADALTRWVGEVAPRVALLAPAHIHLDDLIGDGFDSTRAATMGEDALRSLVRVLGEEVNRLKPVLSVSLPVSRGLVTTAPALDRLDVEARVDRAPSLILIDRDAFGRVARTMEEYELPLKVEPGEAQEGAFVWYYRSWRSSPPEDDEYWRGVYLEYALAVSS